MKTSFNLPPYDSNLYVGLNNSLSDQGSKEKLPEGDAKLPAHYSRKIK